MSESFRRKNPSRRMPENRADTHPLALSGTRSQLTLGDDAPLLKSNRDARHCCRVSCSFAARSKKGGFVVDKSLLKLDSASNVDSWVRGVFSLVMGHLPLTPACAE